jgi:hypothetical protein
LTTTGRAPVSRATPSETRAFVRENRAVGFRESINQRPRLVTAVTVAVIVLSLVAIVIQQRALPSRGDGRGAPYDVPDGTDRPVGDDAPHPDDRKPAAPAPRVTTSPSPRTLRVQARTPRTTQTLPQTLKTETLA